jgi:ADP-ribose pyrophosphatase YjhB (NUDIX family)
MRFAAARLRVPCLEVEIPGSGAAPDGQQLAVRSNGQDWIVSWFPPPIAPSGTPHGAQGVCVTSDDKIVLVSENGDRWGFPAGRPEPGENWEDTLRREMLEEACATVLSTRLLGFTRGECVAGAEQGLVLVRSMWRADVELAPWEPQFEIRHRQVIPATDIALQRILTTDPFAPIIRRSLNEAAIAWDGSAGGNATTREPLTAEPRVDRLEAGVMDADGWRYWEQLIDKRGIVIDRPHGQPHPVYADMTYPFDYGHIPGTASADGHEVDAFVGWAQTGLVGLISLTHRPTGIADPKLLVNITQADAQTILAFLDRGPGPDLRLKWRQDTR